MLVGSVHQMQLNDPRLSDVDVIRRSVKLRS
jgi:hypothetical protein